MNKEVGRDEFYAKLASGQARSMCVLLVLPERTTDGEGTFEQLARTAASLEETICWARIAFAELAILSDLTWEVLGTQLNEATQEAPTILVCVGALLNPPIERFASLELGLHEAGREHPNVRMFALHENTVVPFG